MLLEDLFEGLDKLTIEADSHIKDFNQPLVRLKNHLRNSLGEIDRVVYSEVSVVMEIKCRGVYLNKKAFKPLFSLSVSM